ncbi:MAG TPA: hypothetical protein VG271_10730, partial [Beijerinckiaceae bacterium]|nr:hypothetical protein [Beijerinckiaceae bacterium]
MIDSKSLERHAGEKPVPTFSHPTLARFAVGRRQPTDKNSRNIKILEHVPRWKSHAIFPQHALEPHARNSLIACSNT